MIDFYVPKEKWSDFDDCFTVISIHHLYQMKIYDYFLYVALYNSALNFHSCRTRHLEMKFNRLLSHLFMCPIILFSIIQSDAWIYIAKKYSFSFISWTFLMPYETYIIKENEEEKKNYFYWTFLFLYYFHVEDLVSKMLHFEKKNFKLTFCNTPWKSEIEFIVCVKWDNFISNRNDSCN